MKIYISGPMTGIINNNYDEFISAQIQIENEGNTVLNPANLPSGLTQEQYMDIDLAMLRASDSIYMLRGWPDSKGANVEHAYAVFLGIPIIYQGRL